MGFRIAVTLVATEDLEGIRLYLANHNPVTAHRIRTQLIKELKSISAFPRMGRMVPEIGNPAIRELIRTPYRIIYRIKENDQLIEILRFWHGARGTPNI